MATTLQIDSFDEINLRERTNLATPAQAADDELVVASTQGYEVGQVIYVGQLSREGCERSVIASVDDETTLGLVDELELPHELYAPVTAVLGDLIHVYRAANVDGSVPDDDAFTVLATRAIDPDQLSTYYRDSAGSSSYWYRMTYYNATSGDGTSLQSSVPVRGDDFGHYASLSEIRSEAGFTNSVNLKDSVIDQQRRAAESEINGTLAAAYTVPFSPVPETVKSLTIKLAAAMLLIVAYGNTPANEKLLKTARAEVQKYADREAVITDDDGASTATAAISSYPDTNGNDDENAPRAFTMRQKF